MRDSSLDEPARKASEEEPLSRRGEEVVGSSDEDEDGDGDGDGDDTGDRKGEDGEEFDAEILLGLLGDGCKIRDEMDTAEGLMNVGSGEDVTLGKEAHAPTFFIRKSTCC